MFRSGAQFMILVLLVGLFASRESQQGIGRACDEAFADFLARNSHRTEAPAPLTVVEIDDASLAEHPWPWTPLDFALFFQSANGFRPEVLATHELLRWDANADPALRGKLPQYKKILREHILRAPRVLLGAELGFPDDPTIIPPLEEAPIIRRVQGDLSAIPEFTTVGAQAEEDFRLSSAIGFTNLPDAAQPLDRAPLLLRYRGQVVPSFVLQAILQWEKLTPDDVSVVAGERITLGEQVDIPIDRRGSMRVDFGVPRTRCDFEALVLATAQTEAQRTPIVPREALEGKFLLLGRTDRAARTLRFGGGVRGSATDLFAAAIATIQSRSFLTRVPVAFDLALLGVVAVASCWAPRWPKGRTVFVALISLVMYVMIALVVFGLRLIWLPIVLPAALALWIPLLRLLMRDAPGEISSRPA